MTPTDGDAALARTLRIVGLSALADVVLGAALYLYARSQDSTALAVVGIILAVVGTLVGVAVYLRRGRPTLR